MSSTLAYLVGHIRVLDAAKWADYRSRVPATIAPWGGELVLRGQGATVLAGEHDATDTVVLRFPDSAALEGWHASAAYQAIVPLRREAAEVTLIAYDDAS
jgi:uncharacterized protein (DUF1330 family)